MYREKGAAHMLQRTRPTFGFHMVATALGVLALWSLLGIAPALAQPTRGTTFTTTPTDSSSTGRTCRTAADPTPVLETAAPAAVPAVNSPDSPRVRNLGTGRQPVTFVTTLDLSEAMPTGVNSLNTSIAQFQRPDGTALEPEQVVASATISPNSRRMSIRLQVCIDPVIAEAQGARVIKAAPGSYTGTVLIDDPRVAGGAATYTINMQDERVGLVCGIGLVSWLIGVVGGIAFATGLRWTAIREGATLIRAVIAVATSFGAAVTLIVTQYFDDPSWQGSVGLFVKLAITIVGATYVAANFAGSVGRAGDGKPAAGDGKPAAGGGDPPAGH